MANKNTVQLNRETVEERKNYIFLPAFGKRTPHFQFVLGHANYVAGSDNIRSLCDLERRLGGSVG